MENTKDVNQTLRSRVSLCMAHSGVRRDRLAQILDVSETDVLQKFHGQIPFTFEEIVKMCKYWVLPSDYLLGLLPKYPVPFYQR